MTFTLIFLFLVLGIAGWWLSQQRLTSKPWLEVGLDPGGDGAGDSSLPKGKTGLVVLLGVVGIFFALFTSGYLMRQELSDWRNIPMPAIVWLNTGLLALASLSLHRSVLAARDHNRASVNVWLMIAGAVTIGFLIGQMTAWQQLADSGFVLAENPANSFFYVLTGLHGLHILGGLVALGRTGTSALQEAPLDTLRPRIELCALYWHFLLIIWITLLAVMLGWAHDPFIISHN
ncbi:MAG: cytochrome c oxidase subunit 3 [Paracoccaceae bacterium]